MICYTIVLPVYSPEGFVTYCVASSGIGFYGISFAWLLLMRLLSLSHPLVLAGSSP